MFHFICRTCQPLHLLEESCAYQCELGLFNLNSTCSVLLFSRKLQQNWMSDWTLARNFFVLNFYWTEWLHHMCRDEDDPKRLMRSHGVAVDMGFPVHNYTWLCRKEEVHLLKEALLKPLMLSLEVWTNWLRGWMQRVLVYRDLAGWYVIIVLFTSFCINACVIIPTFR